MLAQRVGVDLGLTGNLDANGEMHLPRMYRRGISMEQITRAILLGCARKYVALLNAGTRTPITSLH